MRCSLEISKLVVVLSLQEACHPMKDELSALTWKSLSHVILIAGSTFKRDFSPVSGTQSMGPTSLRQPHPTASLTLRPYSFSSHPST